MTNWVMAMNKISTEYAAALFSLAAEQGTVTAVADALAVIEAAIQEHPEYLSVLHSPAIPLQERLDLIDAAFGGIGEQHVLSFVKLLCERGHLLTLSDCIAEYGELVKQESACVTATVYYAEELDEKQKLALVEKLSKRTGKTVQAVYVQDASLIGGIKVQLGDTVLDGSVAGRLNEIKGVIGV